MKKNIDAVLQIKQLLLILGLITFSYSTMASEKITLKHVKQLAKIAAATGTDITITKGDNTVEIHGCHGNTHTKVKKPGKRQNPTVPAKKWRKLSAKNKGWEKLTDASSRGSYSQQPQAFEVSDYTTPEDSYSSGRPPVLDE